MTKSARVGLIHNATRRQGVYDALDAVRDDITSKLQPVVMLKPNCLSNQNQLASTHVDALRGAMDFLMSVDNRPDEVIVAEGANEDFSGEAFENFYYAALADEYPIPVRLVDLNAESRWQEAEVLLADGSTTTVRMPRIVLDCPCTVSVAIAKTHDVCVVTLALKNLIMGTLCKPDRIKMHGFLSHAERVLPDEAQVLNINLMRVARHLCPDIAIVDGTIGLQGNGPGGTDRVELKAVAAGSDVFAVDTVMTLAMGFDPQTMGTLQYARQHQLGATSLDEIEVIGTHPQAVVQSFLPHETTELQLQWQVENAAQLLA